jgi:hypothetical protein
MTRRETRLLTFREAFRPPWVKRTTRQCQANSETAGGNPSRWTGSTTSVRSHAHTLIPQRVQLIPWCRITGGSTNSRQGGCGARRIIKAMRDENTTHGLQEGVCFLPSWPLSPEISQGLVPSSHPGPGPSLSWLKLTSSLNWRMLDRSPAWGPRWVPGGIKVAAGGCQAYRDPTAVVGGAGSCEMPARHK